MAERAQRMRGALPYCQTAPNPKAIQLIPMDPGWPLAASEEGPSSMSMGHWRALRPWEKKGNSME